MDFHMEADLPQPPAEAWTALVDVERMAACIPGCEQVVQEAPLERYRAVMKQKIGPFRLEVPAEIIVEEYDQPNVLKARASGKDKYTGTTLNVLLSVRLEPQDCARTRLHVDATLQVAGRLASLGYSVIKKKAEENFAEFEKRFTAMLETA